MGNIIKLIKKSNFVSINLDPIVVGDILAEYINRKYKRMIRFICFDKNCVGFLEFYFKNEDNVFDEELYDQIKEDYDCGIGDLCTYAIGEELNLEPSCLDVQWDNEDDEIRLLLPLEDFLKIKNI